MRRRYSPSPTFNQRRLQNRGSNTISFFIVVVIIIIARLFLCIVYPVIIFVSLSVYVCLGSLY